MPSLVSNSVTPVIERTSNSSPTRNALASGKSRTPSISSKRSLGMTRIVSQCSLSRSSPHSAFCLLKFPSELNGYVTTAMVRAPWSLASRAICPAAPVPDPPPMPAVMMANWVSSVIFFKMFSDSRAAASPFVGSPPAPLPLAVLPINIFCSIGLVRRA